jgi:hypothetical protein
MPPAIARTGGTRSSLPVADLRWTHPVSRFRRKSNTKCALGIVGRTWAYPAPEPKAELTRIEFRGSLGGVDEPRRIERHRIAVCARVVKEAPTKRNGRASATVLLAPDNDHDHLPDIWNADRALGYEISVVDVILLQRMRET